MTARLPYGPPYRVQGLKVLVVGLARSGIAAARLCVREGAQVTVADARPEIDLSALDGLAVTRKLGPHDVADFTGADLVVVSPGVPLSIAPLKAARDAGVPIIGETELAASFLTDLPCVAITGTNGKSTTTALVGTMLHEAGMRPFVGGNIGLALSEAVLRDERPGSLVLELSSFQLDTIIHLRPHVAAVLNLTPDHLDRHGDLTGYATAKRRIFMAQGQGDDAVINGDDPRVVELSAGVPSQVHRFVRGDAPAGGCGVTDDGLVIRLQAEERYQPRSPALRGPHNAANAAAAALCARLAGADASAVQRALDRFPGLPHRLERIRVRGGVEWINDSKATNVDSAQVALASFLGGLVWIVGGRGKGTPYAPLAEGVRTRVKALLAIGEDGPRALSELGAHVDGPSEDVGDLETAVRRAAELAEDGDVVLLSPACASYDQFQSYEARGARFRELVEALP